MSPVIQLGSLLLCLVVADICTVSHEPRLKNENENELLSRNASSPHTREDVDKKGRIRCLACKKLMKKTMPTISKKLTQILNSACRMFRDFHRGLCKIRALELHDRVMKFWFPNNSSKEGCIKLNLCRKHQIYAGSRPQPIKEDYHRNITNHLHKYTNP